MSPGDGSVGPTRVRDLLVVAVVAAALAYALVRFNYTSLPRLPRLAGAGAALIGIGEAVVGYGLRGRIRAHAQRSRQLDDRDRDRFEPPAGMPAIGRLPAPVPPLTAARALAVAKASALAGAAFAGLWVGVGAYVLPSASLADAPAADSLTAILGIAGAAVLITGALYLEYCCRAPRSE